MCTLEVIPWVSIRRFDTDDESGKQRMKNFVLGRPGRMGLTPFRDKGIKSLLALTQGLKYKKTQPTR